MNPTITVIDGHPQSMAFLGSKVNGEIRNLGVKEFGQSGTPADLYRNFGIDADGIYTAASEMLATSIQAK